MPISGLGLPAYKSYWLSDHFFVSCKVGSHNRSRNIKPEVVFKVQKMARYASFCLIMGPFKEGVPAFARLWPVRVRVRAGVSFTTGAVRSAILATGGLLVVWSHNPMEIIKYKLRFPRRLRSGCTKLS